MFRLRDLSVKWGVLFVLIIIGCTTASSQRPLSKAEVTVEPSEPTTLKTHTPVQIYTKGAEYAAQGRFKEAKEEFESALKAEPYFTPAEESLKVIEDVINQKIKSETAIHFCKAVAHRLKGQRADAIAEFGKAIEINSMFALAYNNRGIAYRLKGRLDQAISDHNKAIKIYPGYVNAYISRGITYERKRQLAQALDNYNKAIELKPNYPLAYFYRGRAYRHNGQYDQAIADFNKAIETDPKFARAFTSRGIAYLGMGQIDEAIADHNKAIEINSGFAGAYNNRAISYFYKGEYDKVWSDIHKAQSLGYQVSPKFLEALRTAEAMATAFTFQDVSRTEKILNNGKEPRQKLRYKFQPGKKHILVMDMQSDMSIELGDYTQPEKKSPVIQMKVGINCQEVSPEGNLHYEFKFDTVEIIDEMGMPPEEVTATKTNVKSLEGISGWMIVSPRGATIDGKFNVPPNFNPILKQMVDNLFHQFQNLSIIFPEEPVGIDSQWQVTWHFAKPSEIIQVANFKLVDLKGNKGKLKVSVKQNAKPHKAEFPNLPTGSTVRIESMKSTGTGSITFDLTTVVPKSEAEIGTSVKGIIEAGDQKVDMNMDMNMRVKMQSK